MSLGVDVRAAAQIAFNVSQGGQWDRQNEPKAKRMSADFKQFAAAQPSVTVSCTGANGECPKLTPIGPGLGVKPINDWV
eukprot:COSAG04_NODE_9824_length_829_cov_1.142466_1_plen_78_part_10